MFAVAGMSLAITRIFTSLPADSLVPRGSVDMLRDARKVDHRLVRTQGLQHRQEFGGCIPHDDDVRLGRDRVDVAHE